MKTLLLLTMFLFIISPAMADCLAVQVVEYDPVGDQKYSVDLLAGPADLDSAIETLEVVNVEERDVDTVDASGNRVRKKRHYYFVSIVLDTTGYTSLKELAPALNKPNQKPRPGVRVIVNGSSQGQRFWLDHENKKAYLRLVLFEEQIFPLLKVVKKPWKDNPKGNSTINDWTEGKTIPGNLSLVE